jgi:hypothetical protein
MTDGKPKFTLEGLAALDSIPVDCRLVEQCDSAEQDSKGSSVETNPLQIALKHADEIIALPISNEFERGYQCCAKRFKSTLEWIKSVHDGNQA